MRVDPTAPASRLARLVSDASPAERGSGALPVDLDDLVVDVAGVGLLRSPLPPAQCKALIALGEPAPFGLGTETLHDTRVRDTWQIPIERVNVDWGGRLARTLDTAAAVLDLPLGSRLTAELHSMLVYAKGQFFAAHQDSEKADAMVATLVVTLPSRHTGGDLAVHDRDRVHAYPAALDKVSAVVLYADRLHEVRPVRSGHRVSLTFDLLVEQPADPVTEAAVVDQAASLLHTHFATPWPARWRGEDVGYPRLFGYLLDHQYTAAGLSWSRLKGSDVQPAQTLRCAVEQLGGEAVLALTDIHQVWDAAYSPPGWRSYDEDDLEDLDELDDVEPGELIDDEIAVTHWLLPEAPKTTEVSLGLDTREVGAGRQTATLPPYNQQYEGYMGNYGNTIDRWYRRAAVLVWPQRLAFANRAEASPQTALEDLDRRTAGGDPTANQDVLSLAPFWTPAIRSVANPRALFTRALTVAARLDGSAAQVLLLPFAIPMLQVTDIPAVGALCTRHGTDWVVAQLNRWTGPSHHTVETTPQWLAELPDLADALREWSPVAAALVGIVWSGVERSLTQLAAMHPRPSVLVAVGQQIDPTGCVLQAAARAGQPELARQIAATVTGSSVLLPVAVGLSWAAREWAADTRRASGVGDIARYAAQQLSAELATAPRDPDDWSMTLPLGCDCKECTTLAAFLADPTERVLSWPLAQQGRDHVERQLRAAEAPVAGHTIKKGRPYTLQLTKTADLFHRETTRRQRAQTDLTRLTDVLSQWA